MYDVIVVGAGPAGSTAAKVLADKGLHVLLVERHKLPRYKSCSGVLIQKTVDLVRRYYGQDVPLSATCTPVENRGMIFTDDKGREFRFEQGGLNVWRSSFDNWLTEQAAASGAEVRDSTSAISCGEQDDLISITLREESSCTEQARYVIDCEGVTGVLKRKLLGNCKDFITTFQTFNRGTIQLDPHYFYAYLGSTEKVEIGEYMQGNYNIYAKKPCRIRKCAPIRYFNDADHSLVMQYIHAGSTCAAPQNRHFCV